MKRFTRLALAAGAMFAALAFSGSAWAAYAPTLSVTSTQNAPGRPTTILLGHIQTAADDPTAKDTIYAPTRLRGEPESGRRHQDRRRHRSADPPRRRERRSGRRGPGHRGQSRSAHGQPVCSGHARGRLEAEHHGRRLTVDGPDLRGPGHGRAGGGIRLGEDPALPRGPDRHARRRSAPVRPLRRERGLHESVEHGEPHLAIDVHAVHARHAEPEPCRNDRGPGPRARTGQPDDEVEEPQARARHHLRQAAGRRQALSRGNGRAVRSVQAQRPDLPGGQKKVAQTRTNAQGNYTFRRKIKKRTRFGAQVLGSPTSRCRARPHRYRECRRAAGRRRSRSSPSRSSPQDAGAS